MPVHHVQSCVCVCHVTVLADAQDARWRLLSTCASNSLLTAVDFTALVSLLTSILMLLMLM